MHKGGTGGVGSETCNGAAFAALAWWPVTEKDWAKKLLGMICLACMAMMGSSHTAPTAELEVILNLPPLDFFFRGEAEAAAVRLTAQ